MRLNYLLSAVVLFSSLTVACGASEPKVAATDAQARAFVDTFRRYERAVFDAFVSGDPGEFPAVFYNDPAIRIGNEQGELIRRERTAVDAIQDSTTLGPVGARSGLLASQIAGVVEYERQAAAWDAARAQAAREGRSPAIRDLPDGVQPIERKLPGDWISTDIAIHSPMIQGNHGYAIFSSGTAELAGTLLHVTFTNINGVWYISDIRGEGRG